MLTQTLRRHIYCVFTQNDKTLFAHRQAHAHKYTCTAAWQSHLLVVVEKFLSTKCCAVMTQVCEFSNLACVPDYCIMASA